MTDVFIANEHLEKKNSFGNRTEEKNKYDKEDHAIATQIVSHLCMKEKRELFCRRPSSFPLVHSLQYTYACGSCDIFK